MKRGRCETVWASAQRTPQPEYAMRGYNRRSARCGRASAYVARYRLVNRPTGSEARSGWRKCSMSHSRKRLMRKSRRPPSITLAGSVSTSHPRLATQTSRLVAFNYVSKRGEHEFALLTEWPLMGLQRTVGASARTSPQGQLRPSNHRSKRASGGRQGASASGERAATRLK